jgi:hypothetical protein
MVELAQLENNTTLASSAATILQNPFFILLSFGLIGHSIV